MHVTIILFTLLAITGLASIIGIFRVKDLLHSIVLLSILFISISLVYLTLSQPLLAALQLLVMVGGVSTYLFIGTASQGFSRFKHTNVALLLVGALIIFGVMIYPVASNASQYSQASSNTFSVSSQSQFLAADAVLFYIIALLLFGIGLGAIVMYKKIGAGKWR